MAILLVVAAAALIFIGWNIYLPLQKVMTEGPKTASSVVSHAASHASSKAKTTSSSSSSSVSSSVSSSSAVHAIYLSGSSLTASGISQTLASAKNAGVTTAIAELKSDDGVLHYASTSTEAKTYTSLVASGALSASEIAADIKTAGMTPAAYISCFKDPLAPTLMSTAGVKYSGSTTMNWLDESNDRWLNPYSSTATQYLDDLASEIAAAGFKTVYIGNVQFPDGQQSHTYYGSNLGTKESALQTFVTALVSKVHAAGSDVTIVLPAAAAEGSGTASLGQDQDPYSYGADTVSPLFTPASLTGVTVNGTALSPSSDLTGAISAAAAGLKTANSAKYSKTVPFIQAGTVSGSSSVASDGVTAAISALKTAGISNYVLYATGTYDLPSSSSSSSASWSSSDSSGK